MSQNLKDWKAARQRCRTDLHYLCYSVLGYKDVGEPHARIMGSLQRFVGGWESSDTPTLKDGCCYRPKVPMWDLQGKRKNLILVSRGFLKSTIATQAHSIQWIINYPDVRIKIISARKERALQFLGAIKEHFEKNEVFRALFPEFCPRYGKSGKLEDFGTTEYFTVPCRQTIGIREDTVSIASADSSVAGGHYDVTKIDDLVEDQNVRTPDSIEQIKTFYAGLRPLVELRNGKYGWVDLIGTIYSFSDLHYTVRDAELAKPKAEREWKILSQPACVNYPDPAGLQWPERLTMENLKAIEQDVAEGPRVLYPQYLLQPLTDSDGLINSENDIRWIPMPQLEQLWPRMTQAITIDLGGIEGNTSKAVSNDNDYSCLNLHGWLNNRCYIKKLVWGRMKPDELIEHLFALLCANPRVMSVKIEKENQSRVLMPSIRSAMGRDDAHPFVPIDELQRDNRVSKVARIKATQPWWKNKGFVFADDLAAIPPETRRHLVKEVLYFPKFNHDDILDTIADAMQGRDGQSVPEILPQGHMLPQQEASYDGQVKEWKGIPVQQLSPDAFFGNEVEQEQYCEVTGW